VTTSAWSKVQAFDVNGIMSSGGMVGFNDDRPPAEIEAIRACVIDSAQAEARAQKAQ
jgi:hypothetical protein